MTSTTNDTTHGICSRFTQWKKATRIDKNGNKRWEQIVRMAGIDYPAKSRCKGKYIHLICNLVTKDLDKISESNTHCLVANKFSTNFDNWAVRKHFMDVLHKSEKEAISRKT